MHKTGHKQNVRHRAQQRIFFPPQKIPTGIGDLSSHIVLLKQFVCLHVCVYLCIHIHMWFQELFLSQEIRGLLVNVTLGLGVFWLFYFIEQHRKDAYLLISLICGVWCMYYFNIVKWVKLVLNTYEKILEFDFLNQALSSAS